MNNINEILELPTNEKLLLVEEIWNSIEHDTIQVPKNQQDETMRRLKKFEGGKTKFYSWEEIRADIKKLK